MSSSALPHCYACIGKDCRRDKGYDALIEALDGTGRLQRVACQDICKGPIAGVEVDGHVEWFRKVRKGRHRKALVALAAGRRSKIPSDLKDRRVAGRRGTVKVKR